MSQNEEKLKGWFRCSCSAASGSSPLTTPDCGELNHAAVKRNWALLVGKLAPQLAWPPRTCFVPAERATATAEQRVRKLLSPARTNLSREWTSFLERVTAASGEFFGTHSEFVERLLRNRIISPESLLSAAQYATSVVDVDWSAPPSRPGRDAATAVSGKYRGKADVKLVPLRRPRASGTRKMA